MVSYNQKNCQEYTVQYGLGLSTYKKYKHNVLLFYVNTIVFTRTLYLIDKMKKTLTIILLLISVSSFAKSEQVMDTISNWQVYNGGKLLKAFNAFNADNRILLTKGKIRAVDTLDIKYFDDTPCVDCIASLTIKTDKNKEVRKLDNSLSNYNFKIKTTDLQMLAFKNRSSVLKFYYKEDDTDDEVLLFEIEIR